MIAINIKSGQKVTQNTPLEFLKPRYRNMAMKPCSFFRVKTMNSEFLSAFQLYCMQGNHSISPGVQSRRLFSNIT